MGPLPPFDAGTESEAIRFLDAPPAWVVVLAIVPGAFLLARVAYGWGQVERPGLRAFLGTLRALAFLALVAILCRPVVEKTRFLVRRAPLVVLLDDVTAHRLGRVGVDAEALDPEVVPDRMPVAAVARVPCPGPPVGRVARDAQGGDPVQARRSPTGFGHGVILSCPGRRGGARDGQTRAPTRRAASEEQARR